MTEQACSQRSTVNNQLANEVRQVPVGYKQTDVGLMPEDWEATTVGQVTSWLSGGTPNRKREVYWQGDIPWISGSTLKTLELETSDQFLTSEGVEAGSKMAPLDATLLLVRGSALHSEIRAGLVVAPLCFNQDVKALIPNKSIVPRYLTIYLLAMESELLKLVSSAGNSAGVLDTELVKNFKFLQPPKHEQTAIANALSDVDALISELEKLIAKKQAIKTATMQQLLTGRTRLPQFAMREDGSPTNSSGTNLDAGTGGPKGEGQDCLRKGTKPSELGEIPEDWEVVTLGDIAEVRMCKRILSYQTAKNGEIPFFKIGTFGGEPDAYISESLYREFKDKFSYPEKGDVLISAAGTLGKMVVYDGRPSYFQDSNIVWLEVNKRKISNEYLYQYYKVIKWASSEGSTISRLYNGIIKASVISIPTLAEQTTIATILTDMDAEIQTLQQRLGKTCQIKQGMMQELLTGKTRLVQPSLTDVCHAD